MFVIVPFLIFSIALFGVAWHVWVTPRQQAERVLDARLRGVRTGSGANRRGPNDLIRTETRGSLAFLGDLVQWGGTVRRLQAYIDQADLKWHAADIVAISIGIFVITYLILSLAPGIFLLHILVALAIGSAPIAYIVRKRNQRISKFEAQLPDAIDLFTRTMRAGHNIHSGLETIAAESPDPVRQEFRKLMEELALGSQIEPALHGLGQRIPIVDLKFFITGLILQRQTGANMVQVLENLSVLVRERLNMSAKLKAHTAQQRFSAGLLCALPLVVGLGFWVLKPDYIRLLWTDPIGSKFFTYAVVSEVVGIIVIRRMANVKF